ncbi:LuxR C-terminal-related transcriptional regulator [Bacillus tianshenii]|nr:LuxR C-terminal-related transcriptional regulator [Bacillus tianshenii]
MHTSLFPNDYEKMLHFATTIAQPTENIRSLIQHELAAQFGYDESIFWLADDNGNLTNPLPYRIHDKVVVDYIEEYFEYDYLHPKKHLNLFRSNKALRLSDLTTFNEYENSTYYRSFMQPNGYYDEMVVALMNSENSCVGVLGMARRKDTMPFTTKDCKRFQLLSELIGTTLSRQTKPVPSLLSKREAEVTQLLKEGRTNQEIAQELYISLNTVKKHLQNIFQKYEVRNRVQLVKKL